MCCSGKNRKNTCVNIHERPGTNWLSQAGQLHGISLCSRVFLARPRGLVVRFSKDAPTLKASPRNSLVKRPKAVPSSSGSSAGTICGTCGGAACENYYEDRFWMEWERCFLFFSRWNHRFGACEHAREMANRRITVIWRWIIQDSSAQVSTLGSQ